MDEIPVVSTISNIETNGVLEDKGFELAQEDENQVGLSAKKQRKRTVYFWTAAGLLFVGVVATALVWMNSANQPSSNTDASSTSTSQTNDLIINRCKCYCF